MNLEMNEAIKGRLEALRDDTHADSISEVIRRAIIVYDRLWVESSKGSSMIVRSEDGTEKQLLLP